MPELDAGGLPAEWPSSKDLTAFQPTAAFNPEVNLLAVASDVPDPLKPLMGTELISANTVGDGACGLHATFGLTNSHGQLDFGQGHCRDLAAGALGEVMKCSDKNVHFEGVRSSLWQEFAVPALKGTKEGVFDSVRLCKNRTLARHAMCKRRYTYYLAAGFVTPIMITCLRMTDKLHVLMNGTIRQSNDTL